MLTSPLLRGGSWSLASQLFLTIVIVQTILNISFEAYFISRLEHPKITSPNQTSLYTIYGGGCIAAQIFALLLTCAALHVRSEPLVTAATAFDLLLILFQAAQIAQTASLIGAVATQATSIIVLVAGCAAKSFVVWKRLMKEFGWQVYRALGADLKMQRMFLSHQILLSLVTLTAFFFLELWLQLAAITVQTDGQEGSWVQNILILIFFTVLLSMCLFAAVQELLWLMYGCVGIFAIAPAFFLYKLVVVNRHHAASSKSDHYATTRKYLNCFLVVLLIMNLALLSITIIVARTFGKGLRQRLRHFQILARGEVDLEAIPKQDETTATSTICAAEKNIQDDNRPLSPSVPKGEGSGLSEFVTSAKSSLKESSMLFKAFFSGLGNTDDLESLESLHRESVEVWEQAAPGLANPQLINIFESLSKNASSLAELNGKQSTENLSKYSNHLKHSPQISPSMSKIGDGSNTVQFGSRSTAQGTVSFALSTDELNTINGNAELLNTKQSYVKPTKTSTELRGIGSLKKADPHDHRSTDKIVAASNYADDCALYNTLQQHAVLRVANADSTQDSNDKNDNFVSSRSTINCQMDTLRSVLSYSTAPTSNASFGSAGGSKAKLVNEGFDLSI